MTENMSRRDVIKKSVKAGLVIGGVAAVGTAGYKMFSSKSIDDIYWPYPDDSKLKKNLRSPIRLPRNRILSSSTVTTWASHRMMPSISSLRPA